MRISPITRLLGKASRALLLGSVLGVGIAAVTPAFAQTKLKLILNWKYQGPQGMFFLAEDLGYFKAENLEVTMDQGSGSGAAVPLVANGAYDMGFGDLNALIEFAAKKPDDAPIAISVLYNMPPFVIAVKADSPIKEPKDLVGKTLGGPVNDGSLKLFPAFCSAAKIDCSSVTVTNVAPNLREQMLMQGQVDGVFGYINTVRFSARQMGVDEKQLRFISYADYGLDLYSNSIIASRKLVKENPEALKGFLRALNKGIVAALKDPDAAIAAVVKREPLIKPAIDKALFEATVRSEMSHPEIAKVGLGDVDVERLKRSIDTLVSVNQLPRTPAVSDVFTPAFLPPLSDRPTKLF